MQNLATATCPKGELQALLLQEGAYPDIWMTTNKDGYEKIT